MAIRIIMAALLVAVVSATTAADFDAGVTAYDRGEYAVALREFRPLAEQGDARAQFALGYMYDEGNGVPQAFPEAATWFRKAAEQGNASAQYNLGLMYDEGEGTVGASRDSVFRSCTSAASLINRTIWIFCRPLQCSSLRCQLNNPSNGYRVSTITIFQNLVCQGDNLRFLADIQLSVQITQAILNCLDGNAQSLNIKRFFLV